MQWTHSLVPYILYKYRPFLEKTWLLSHAPNRRAVGERTPLVSGVLYFSPQKQTAILLIAPRPRLRRFYPKAQTNISPKNRHKRANLFPRTFWERHVKHTGTAAARTTLRRLTGTDPRGTARSCSPARPHAHRAAILEPTAPSGAQLTRRPAPLSAIRHSERPAPMTACPQPPAAAVSK